MHFFFNFLLTLGLGMPLSSQASLVSLKDLIHSAESKDHRNQAAAAKEQAFESNISIQNSTYFPSLKLEAADSTGFAGSTAAMGLGGMVASPYRSGAAVGLVLQQDLWDFGRTGYAVDASKNEFESQKAVSKEMESKIAREAAHAFFSCVMAKAELETWTEIAAHSKTISNEATKFVKTGQRSVVEKYLSKNQFNEYVRRREDAKIQTEFSIRYLNQIAFSENDSMDCPTLDQIHFTALPIDEDPKQNPTYSVLASNKMVAESHVKLAKADYYPKLVGLAAVGLLENTRLVEKQDYSLGIGLEFPIYEGGITKARVHQAESKMIQKEADLLAETDEIKKMNLILNEKIESERAKIESLVQELKDAREAFELAQKRYFGQQGSLFDLRESLKYLLSTQTDSNQARVNFLRYSADKAIYNGQIEKLNGI